MPETGPDERVSRLEGRVQGFDGRFDAIDRRFDAVDRRFESVERRIEALRVDLGGRIAALDAKFDQKTTRYFIWLVGIQVAVLLAVVTALTR